MSNGLFKVNLHSFHAVQFSRNENNPNEIRGDQVNGLKKAADGGLWVAHSYGLDWLSQDGKQVLHFSSIDNPDERYFNYLLDVEVDKHGDVWLATAKVAPMP